MPAAFSRGHLLYLYKYFLRNTSKLQCKTASVFVPNSLLPQHSKLECDLPARGFFSTLSFKIAQVSKGDEMPHRIRRE